MVSSDVYWNIVERNNNGEGTDITENGVDYCYYMYKRTVNVPRPEPSPLRELHDHFRVLHFGHSDRDDVRAHTFTQYPGVPVYWLGGSKIADNYDDFYAGGTPGASDGSRNEHGQHFQSDRYSYGISPIFKIADNNNPPGTALISNLRVGNNGFGTTITEGDTISVILFLSVGNREGQLNYRITASGNYLSPGQTGDIKANTTGGVHEFELATIDDDTVESDGTVTITLLPSTKGLRDYHLTNSKSITFTVRDNDSPPPPSQECTHNNPCISMHVLDKSSFEGDNVIVRFDIEPYRSGVSPYTEPGETRTPGGDDTIAIKYTTHGQALTTNRNGETRTLAAYGSSFYDVLHTTTDCNPNSGSRNEITFELLDGPGYQIKEGTATTKTITLGEADSPAVYINTDAIESANKVNNMTVYEGNSFALADIFTTKYTCDSEDITVNFNLAQTGDSFAAITLGDKTQNIPMGSERSSGVYTVVSRGPDAVDEPDGTVTITIKPGNYRIGQPSSVTLAVLDDDEPPPEVFIASRDSSQTITEGNNIRLRFTGTGVANATQIYYNVHETGNVITNDGNLNIAMHNGINNFAILTDDDNTDEVDSTVTITLRPSPDNPPKYTISNPAPSVTYIVRDNDPGPLGSGGNSPPPPTTVSIGISSGGSEGDPVSFSISATPSPLQSPLPVNVTLSDAGNVLNASDTGWRIVEIPPIGSYTLEVPTINDGVIDVNNVTLTINPGAGYTPGQFASWTVDVQDAGTTSSLMQPPVYDKLTQAQNLTAVAIDPALVANVTAMASQVQHGDAHVDRWNRVLAAFGEIDHSNPMTAAEAQTNAEKYSSPLWPQIVDVLTLLEAEAAAEQDDPQTPPDTPPAIDPALINSVRELAAQTHHGDAHVDRWNRVLAAFGEIDHSNPMTAAEAQTNAEKYSSPLWPQIANALAARE